MDSNIQSFISFSQSNLFVMGIILITFLSTLIFVLFMCCCKTKKKPMLQEKQGIETEKHLNAEHVADEDEEKSDPLLDTEYQYLLCKPGERISVSGRVLEMGNVDMKHPPTTKTTDHHHQPKQTESNENAKEKITHQKFVQSVLAEANKVAVKEQ